MSSSIYFNPQARHWQYGEPTPADVEQHIQAFHHSLPGFGPTPLVPLDALARELGVRAVWVKDEGSARLPGLPAFKILGAAWATLRAVGDEAGLAVATTSLADAAAAARARHLTLYAATEGNHGRAVARMAAGLLGVPARIYVPEHTSEPVRRNIASEGADVRVVRVPGDYDSAVAAAARDSGAHDGGLLIQDNAFAGYEQIPRYIVEGYSTMLAEVEQQLPAAAPATMIITPVGVGSLAHAVSAHAKSGGRRISVVAVEPVAAACLHANLTAAATVPATVPTSDTIMDGLCCGTVSPVSWPTLQRGVDASLTITDRECHAALQYLHGRGGVKAGPCGAASLAALLRLARETGPSRALLDKDSVVVLLCTEGDRWYEPPS